ncbi:MAG: STM4015 family protein, partial [Streptomycetaceae bacterium]|nr:STM4015 family protein [Streptomycetaceae bacterium]
MSIYEHLDYFCGLPVADFRPPPGRRASARPGRVARGNRHGDAAHHPRQARPDAVAWRLTANPWDDDACPIAELYDHFVRSVDTTRVTALVLGAWDDDMSGENPLVDLLTRDAHRFPALRHLFVDEVLPEESEISWLGLPPLTALLQAYPRLEDLSVRGSEEAAGDETPALLPLHHTHLRRLRFESGGLSARIVQAVGLSDLPALEHLELWLGVTDYGGDATVDDLADILTGARLPGLRHLGLMNSEIQDEIAEAVSGAAVTSRLESLDLSMGTLGDEGAEALLVGQPLGHLRKLTVRHHFIQDRMAARLRRTLTASGVDVALSAPETNRDWVRDGRYL